MVPPGISMAPVAMHPTTIPSGFLRGLHSEFSCVAATFADDFSALAKADVNSTPESVVGLGRVKTTRLYAEQRV
jgi:hypothetical protein